MVEKQHVLLIGAGLMGCGIATAFAKAGHQVMLYRRDAGPESVAATKTLVANGLKMLVDNKALAADQVEPALARVSVTADLGTAAQATLIIDTWPEDLEMKRKLFADLDKLAPPKTILATNSTTLTITEIGTNVVHKDRFLATHFYVPAYVIPLVEVSRTADTADWAVDKVIALLDEIGKVPVRCKDSSGYIAVRLQVTLVMEAIRLLQQGIATPEDIDKAVRNSFAPRLSVFGPLEMADRGGLDIWKISADNLYRIYGNVWYDPPELLKEKVADGEFGVKSGKGFYPDSQDLLKAGHDRYLVGLLQYLGQMPKLD